MSGVEIRFEDTDKVLASNEGDQFHIIWTARRCLKLLNRKDNLRALSVEGVSSKDLSSRGGVLKADTCEYYGGASFEEASRFIMFQLKYSPSPKERKKAWAIGGLKDTLGAFGEDFRKKVKKYGLESVIQKAEYRFVTNRPISPNVLEAVLSPIDQIKFGKHSTNAFNEIIAVTKLKGQNLEGFLSILKFQSCEAMRAEQKYELKREISSYLPGQDSMADLRLEDLIRGRTLLDGSKKIISENDLLRALDISSVDRLLPARATEDFKLPSNYVPRFQEAEIINTIIASKTPIILHATGGVGKSAFALRLKQLMPAGSMTVVFDGFADGLYRQPSEPRHQHNYGLVQIANELAFEGLCNPMLPSATAQSADYLRAFLYRLKQASLAIRDVESDALILIVLDAADNSQYAASSYPANPNSFAKDLLQETMPENCRLVVVGRTERYQKLLSPPLNSTTIELKPFLFDETLELVKTYFPAVDMVSAQEFFRMTCRNPRIQHNALSSHTDFQLMMQSLGTVPLDVNQTISLQLSQSLAKVKEHAFSPENIDKLCTALALLPPLIPINILSEVAEIEQSFIKSFVSDFGRYLIERDDAIHFRDEPVDTWFQDNFSKPQSFSGFIQRLKSLESNSYVALALPKILWEAREIDELMNLATKDDGLPQDNAVEKRRIVLRRVQFSLKAAIKEDRYSDIVKLSMRAGEEVASNDREAKILFDNHDLVSSLMGEERAKEIVFRHHADKWLGESFAYAAAMLCNNERLLGEASHMLRTADGWIQNWAKQDSDKREEVGEESVAALEYSRIFIDGPTKMVENLSHWNPPEFRMSVATNIVKRLIDLGNFSLIDQIAAASAKDPFIIIAIAYELSKVGRFVEKKSSRLAVNALLEEKKDVKIGNIRQHESFQDGIVSLCESAAHHSLSKASIKKLLVLYAPPVPEYGFSVYQVSIRKTIFRAYCLKFALNGSELLPEHLIHKDRQKEEKKSEKRNYSNSSESEDVKAALLPWYKLRTQILIEGPSNFHSAQLQKVLTSTKNGRSYRDQAKLIENEIAEIWLGILIGTKFHDKTLLSDFLAWLESSSGGIYPATKISVARALIRSNTTTDISKFINKIFLNCLAERQSISEKIEVITGLCRAILPWNRDEARLYFEKALMIINRFGDEVSDRWDAITNLASVASNPTAPNPKLAYEFVRTAEVIGDYLPDYFKWENVITTASEICPNSGFALLSRLLDRDKGWIGTMLPALARSLVSRNYLSSEIYTALYSFRGDWSEKHILENALARGSKNTALIFRKLVKHALILDNKEDLKTFAEIALPHNLVDEDLVRYTQFSTNKESFKNISNDKKPLYTKKEPEPIQWKEILGNSLFIDSESIETAITKIEGLHPWPLGELFERMRKCVPKGNENCHITSISDLRSANLYKIMTGLEACRDDWGHLLTVQLALKDSVEHILHRRASELLGSKYSLDEKLNSLAVMIDTQPKNLLTHLLVGVSENLEHIDANGFFLLSSKLSEFLHSDDALDALNYSLSRLESEVSLNDSDGSWDIRLLPPSSFPETVAGFIYLSLSSPLAVMRWQAAHSIVSLVHLGETHLIDLLISFWDRADLPAFRDKNFPFMKWNARLFLIIALARASKNNPLVALRHFDFFKQLCFQQPSHILIRHFARQILLSLYESKPDVFSPQEIQKIRQMNSTQFTPVLEEDEQETTPVFLQEELKEKQRNSDQRRFSVPMDFDTGWIHPLLRIFKISDERVIEKIGNWATGEVDTKYMGKWDDDPRAQSRRFNYYDTECRYGEYPKIDTLSFYTSYHALMHVAAEFVDTIPMIKDDGEWGSWSEWLSEQSLTSDNGYWLADRRDPPPMELRLWQKDHTDSFDHKNWHWEILSKDFDDILFSNDHRSMNLHGDWNIKDGFIEENLSIRSAGVSSDKSIYLLRAAQTDQNLTEFYIPTSESRHENNKFGFNLFGWVSSPTKDLKFDQLDNLSGKIPFPPIQPSKKIINALNLRADVHRRVWTQDQRNVLNCEIWGVHKANRDNDDPSNYGHRLSGNIDFIVNSLKRLNLDLIFQVEIERPRRHQDEEIPYEYRKNQKIYLLRQNGELHTLHRSAPVWRKDCKGT